MNSKKPTVIDLFAGAGGLSLGAARAGFDVAYAVDFDKRALETHEKNFPKSKHFQLNLETVNPAEFLHICGLKENSNITGVIGGPPCQGFSAIGHGCVNDNRNSLFIRFFQLVKEINPAFFVAENVTGIMQSKYDSIRSNAFKEVENYTILPPLKIKANEYGAPTSRTRIFFIGYDPERMQLNENDIINAKMPHNKINVKNALQGLPVDISKCQNGKGVIDSKYIKNSEELSYFHRRAQGLIPKGIGHRETIKDYKKGVVTGCFPTAHSTKIKQRYKQLEFGKMDPISKSTKLDPTGLCPTLRAGTGPEKGSYQAVRPIHYKIPRVITPREAARLQGFPDWFIFQPTIWHSFRQIGNSVSPIVAERLLSVIYHKLT
ncbi:hypothetical protein MmiEs2_10490 [Methanimicrococcus stummii]|uniref:DNA (cytosine-5-)-methyltransferase n=1 Tax=Methanimicrococcus stummii TaxID=3028294 RepID=A0AA96VAD0_9EURY|nr:DNA cytosine methyltransferase [Methanimicrococcus sp. Es2]WNY28841.1 hypothetical protein MmiEs2_10490 [Methanimicrococcus sp. Es2]